MALYNDGQYIPAQPKKTRQGQSKNTKLAATSRNAAKKRYRGQGKRMWLKRGMKFHGQMLSHSY